MQQFGNSHLHRLCWFGTVNIAWDCAERELGREANLSQPELKGQKYLRKDEKKHKWDLAAEQNPAFFAQWSIAASGACVVVLHHTQSRITFLRWILGHALRSRMVMCVLLYAAPTLASSCSNSPFSTVLSTPVLCPQTRFNQVLAKPSLQNLHTVSLQNVLPLGATELLVRGLCLTFSGREERRQGM